MRRFLRRMWNSASRLLLILLALITPLLLLIGIGLLLGKDWFSVLGGFLVILSLYLFNGFAELAGLPFIHFRGLQKFILRITHKKR